MKKRLTLKQMLILFALVPLTVGIILMAIIATNIMTGNLKETTIEELKLAAQALRSYYEYDLVHDNDLEDGFLSYTPEDYIDVIHENIGIDLTIFKDNVRFMTSLRNEDGTRNEGTTASDAVWAEVRSGNNYESYDVVIGGKDYYVYYMPMYNSSGSVCGMAFAGKPTAQIDEAIKHIVFVILALSIGLEIVFVILAILISKKVSAPISEVADRLSELSEGKTGIDIVNNSHIAETVTLIQSTLKLKDGLQSIVGKINTNLSDLNEKIAGTTDNADHVSEDMTQIATSMQDLAQSTQTLAENIQDINTNVIEMGDIVANAVETVDVLHERTNTMTEANKHALECINDISKSSEESTLAVEQISKSISDTNTAVEKINEIVSMISDIASQTNLLSLNASIEAARAGEAGRGFAVVAEEIGKLATESNNSAAEIKNIVAEITGLSKECVVQAESVGQIISREKALLENALEQFEVLNTEIVGSVGNIGEVSEITDKLKDIKDVVLTAITDLSAVSEETSATNEEVTATTETVSAAVEDVSKDMNVMTNAAKELSEAVAFFKV